MDAPSTDADEVNAPRPERGEVFVATVTERAEDATTCTIAPLPGRDQLFLSEWVRAEGSFVSLESVR